MAKINFSHRKKNRLETLLCFSLSLSLSLSLFLSTSRRKDKCQCSIKFFVCLNLFQLFYKRFNPVITNLIF